MLKDKQKANLDYGPFDWNRAHSVHIPSGYPDILKILKETKMPKKGKNVPTNETPSQRFVRLANQRVNRILETNKQLSQLAGTAYESSPEQVRKIEDALSQSLVRTIESLKRKTVVSQEFKL